MKAPQELYAERLNRILTAASLGTPDRVPIVTGGTIFSGLHTGVTPGAFCASPQVAHEAMLKSLQKAGEVDGTQFAVFNPHFLSLLGLAKVQVPGVELPEDAPFQVDEQELMTPEDYDAIADQGWKAWVEDYRFHRLDNLMAKVGPTFGYLPMAMKNFAMAGIPVISPMITMTPFESFMGGRTLVRFMRDIFTLPDRVKAAADTVQAERLAELRHMIGVTRPISIFVGFGRSNRGMISKRFQDRFVYPYAREIVDTIIEAGSIPLLHCDQDWSEDMDFLKSLPRPSASCSWTAPPISSRQEESIGDHMCLMGDVPPNLLVLGRPEEVHAYSRRLIREIGPSGFILCQGCDLPSNAKPENFEAMVAAATRR